jgi:ATP-binding protein involved in chromosome partitioning
MSYFTPAELPDNKYYIFGKEGGKRLANEYGVEFLGEIPLVQSIREGGDNGSPIVLDNESPVSKAFSELATSVAKQVKRRNEILPPTKKVEITT